MNTLSHQQIFDTIVSHLRKQKVRSQNLVCFHEEHGWRTLPGDYKVYYKSLKGLKTPIGCLIPHDVYDSIIEGKKFSDFRYSPNMKIREFHTTYFKYSNLLEELECVHNGNSPDDWEVELQKVAKIFDLNYLPPIKK